MTDVVDRIDPFTQRRTLSLVLPEANDIIAFRQVAEEFGLVFLAEEDELTLDVHSRTLDEIAQIKARLGLLTQGRARRNQ